MATTNMMPEATPRNMAEMLKVLPTLAQLKRELAEAKRERKFSKKLLALVTSVTVVNRP
jgi:hypothetical protein